MNKKSYLLLCGMAINSAMLFTPLCAAEPPQTTTTTDPFTDWVPVDSEDNVCGGYYQAPSFAPLGQQPTLPTATSDQASLATSGESTLTGHVVVTEPNRRLFADDITLHRNAETNSFDTGRAHGHVRIEEPMLAMAGTDGFMRFNDKYTTLNNAWYRIYDHHGRGNAALITYEGLQKKTTLLDANYTTCAPNNHFWHIQASQLTLNQITHQGRATHAKLYIHDVPIFYTPYLAFPLGKERQSGFLTPSIASSSQSGRELRIPYYFNVAPNYDLTLTPRFLEERGVDVETESRYLNPYGYAQLDLNVLPDDKKFASFRRHALQDHPNITDPRDPRLRALEAAQATRTGFSFNQTDTFSPRVTSQINYNYASDDEYIINLGNPFISADDTRQLLRKGALTYNGDFFTAGGLVQGYQTMQPFEAAPVAEPYKILPRLFLNMDYPAQNYPVRYQMTSELTHFAHGDDPITHLSLTTGDRTDIRPAVSFPIERSFGYFTPSMTLAYTHYNLSLGETAKTQRLPDDPTRTLPITSIDTGLYFDRNFSWGHTAYTQTLEPRLYYLYVPFRSQNDIPVFDSGINTLSFASLTSDNRFSGLDRIGDANQLAVLATSHVLRQDTGEERLWGGVGELFYFRDRTVTLCDERANPGCRVAETPLDPFGDKHTSPLIATGGYHFAPHWNASGELQWEPTNHALVKRSVRLNYTQDPRHLLNFSFYSLDNDRLIGPSPGILSPENSPKQVDISGVYGLNNTWALLGRWNYDVNSRLTFSALAGVEYESCCWALQVGTERYLRSNDGVHTAYDNRIAVQFVFKGLAGVGNSTFTNWQEAIPGYNRSLFGTTY